MRSNYYDRLLNLLKTGERNAQSGKALAEKLGTSPRQIRSVVNEARRNGVLVCSTDSGYFMAGCRDELRRSYLRMKAQAQSTNEAIKAMKRALREYEGQESFDIDEQAGD